ncbi:hypothetical protein [Streptomyces sp. NPDC059455]|uniref:hypothetical protein n=1 Tax=Streptomyces sp. NPDC059455 TaxID=3346837 RepID=UPI0036C57508
MVAVERVRKAKSPARSRKTTGRYAGWMPGFNIRLALSAKAIKTVDAIGIEAAVARIRARGGKV